MALSLQDQVALIYTSQGSQRAVARLLGISHQKVGRILKAGQEGGYKADAPTLRDPALRAQVDQGFETHRNIVRRQAQADRLPFNAAVPVFYARLPRTVTTERIDPRTGEIVRVPVIDPATGRPRTVPGDRVAAQNVHFLSDKLRGEWLGKIAKTNKFAAASVGSMVNLAVYKKKGESAQRGRGPRTDKAKASRKSIVQKLEAGQVLSPMYSKPIPLDFPAARINREVDKVLREKHSPATGPELPGTQLADRILLQVDTRNAPRPRKKTGPRAPGKKARR
jgi:hypothetical protein